MSMFNPQQTILLEFNNCLNSSNFEIIENKNIEVYLAELKQFGKVSQQLETNDDLLKALGIKVIKNVFTIKNQPISIFVFISQRFPVELPQVFISEVAKKDWKYKYYFQNPEEMKKDGKYNLTMIITKVQNDITRNGIRIQYVEDLKNLRDTYNPDSLIKSIQKLNPSTLTSSRNPSPTEISQQVRMSKQYIAIIQYFSQLSMLNDSLIKDIRLKQGQLQTQQKKLSQKSCDYQRKKKDFAATFCAVQGIKSNFSKFSIVQWMQDKIKQLRLRAQTIQNQPFSLKNFNDYKIIMKQLKKLQLKKEKIS